MKLSTKLIENAGKVNLNLLPEVLIKHTVRANEGTIVQSGALVIKTGKFTGRTPNDRYIVHDNQTFDSIDWGKANQAISQNHYELLLGKMQIFLKKKTLFVRDAYACANNQYRLNIKIITTLASHNLFAYNMFLRPTEEQLVNFEEDFTVICVPDFEANPESDGVNNKNFVVLNLSQKVVLIGGTAYTGEIKKSVFSALNYYLPSQNVLPMHCSANVGKNGDTAIFFGLSGTGKTTLSADPNRLLIGDDEHGWDQHGVFNFEGGCYAKVIDLSPVKEPDIYKAIRWGAMLENVVVNNQGEVDFSDKSITENTRVSYPIDYISLIKSDLRGETPKNVFFLTCDAFGVLPPISKLTVEQAMYYFLQGYTAKIAGTETGITEPKAVFSACFGAPFMPLHPSVYATMLGEKLAQNNVNVWLVNTGWVGGNYETGSRIKLDYTRNLITEALSGALQDTDFDIHPTFGLAMPRVCKDVPTRLLNPINTWQNQTAYQAQAERLLAMFEENYKKYEVLV